MIMKAKAIICMALFGSTLNVTAGAYDWTPINNEDGIKTYVSTSATNGATPTKVEMVVAATPEKVVKVIADFENYINWVPYCKKSYTIQRVSDTVSYGYQRISAPFVTDRDIAVRLT